jgi:hypothetical protein
MACTTQPCRHFQPWSARRKERLPAKGWQAAAVSGDSRGQAECQPLIAAVTAYLCRSD